jgi:hypothetical protein
MYCVEGEAFLFFTNTSAKAITLTTRIVKNCVHSHQTFQNAD